MLEGNILWFWNIEDDILNHNKLCLCYFLLLKMDLQGTSPTSTHNLFKIQLFININWSRLSCHKKMGPNWFSQLNMDWIETDKHTSPWGGGVWHPPPLYFFDTFTVNFVWLLMKGHLKEFFMHRVAYRAVKSPLRVKNLKYPITFFVTKAAE